MKKITFFLSVALWLFTNVIGFSQEIPDLSFSQQFNYPENDPQDGSPGTVFDPANWTEYNGYKIISYIAVTSYNEIPVNSGEAVIFRIFIPPYTEKFSVSINGPDGLATQFVRVATISESDTNAPFPTFYASGSLPDDEWKWLSSYGNYTYVRDSSYYNVGSAAFLVIYNGANVDDDYDGVADGDYPNTLTIGSFNLSWSIPVQDSLDYINWAHGNITNTVAVQQKKLHVYPNPFSDVIYLDKKYDRIELYTVDGKTMLKSVKNRNYIRTDDLKKGIYILKADNLTNKVVKN